jgi:hypothetical protein
MKYISCEAYILSMKGEKEREHLEAFGLVRGKNWRPEVFAFNFFFFLISLKAGCRTCLTS